MTKYDPLRRHLARAKVASLDLDFTDVERIIGRLLPKAARDEAWWREPPLSSVAPQIEAWTAAGYRARLLGAETVRFERVDPRAKSS
ncbi:DUF7662 domain-containing protein [Caulobacter soli]|uniref:DUF7662 domain-containing protein n=1 Tax=Caulobacter soli TaxID=2708539 RepID=UPI0013EA4780|nr:toxin-antitoxin system, antitoxin component [Caulobacter soli]